jgi:hypothetical protein
LRVEGVAWLAQRIPTDVNRLVEWNHYGTEEFHEA